MKIEPQVTYAGYVIKNGQPVKITSERSSNASALEAITLEAKRMGLEARDVTFFVVEETVTYKPISKTIFTISQNTVLL